MRGYQICATDIDLDTPRILDPPRGVYWYQICATDIDLDTLKTCAERQAYPPDT